MNIGPAYRLSAHHLLSSEKGLLVGDASGYVGLWDLDTERCHARFEGHTGGITCLAELPGGQFVSGSYDKTLRIWDVSTGVCTHLLHGHIGWIHSLALLEQEKDKLLTGSVLLASSDSRASIHIWNPQSGDCLRVLYGYCGWMQMLVPVVGARLASACLDETVQIWDTERGAVELALKGHEGHVFSFARLSTGVYATGSADHTVRLWHPGNGRCIAIYREHTGPVPFLCAFADGVLASGGNELVCWDKTGNCFKAEDEDTPQKVLFMADTGKGTLLVCDGNGKVTLWNPSTVRCIQRWTFEKPCLYAKLLRTGTLIGVCSDGIVRKI